MSEFLHPNPRPLSDEDNRALQHEFCVRLAEAINTTATNFLCTRRDRIPEREHLVRILVEIVSEGPQAARVLQRYVDRTESIMGADYDGAVEWLTATGELEGGR